MEMMRGTKIRIAKDYGGNSPDNSSIVALGKMVDLDIGGGKVMSWNRICCKFCLVVLRMVEETAVWQRFKSKIKLMLLLKEGDEQAFLPNHAVTENLRLG